MSVQSTTDGPLTDGEPGPDLPARRASRPRGLASLALILAGSALLYFWLYDPSRFGSYHDDSLYVTTAKALASGQGYRIISLPYEPAATKYPPLYPFLLSLVWRISSQFPGNINAMVALTAVGTLMFLAITWLYLVRHAYATNWQALLVVAMTAINWRVVIYATGIYSEMIYATLSVAALFLAERLDSKLKGWNTRLALGLLMGLAFLSRGTGVGLLMAVAVYFVMRRKTRRAVLPLSVAGLFVVGWFAWCAHSRTHITGVNVAYYTDYFAHLKNVLLDMRANTNSSMLMTILSVLSTNFLMVVVVSIPVLCLGIDYTWAVYLGFVLMFIAAGFIRDVRRGWRLLHVYIICYLVLHIVWTPFVSFDRYLAPILPFLLLWLVRELESTASLARKTLRSGGSLSTKASGAVVGIAVVLVISVIVYSYGSTLVISVISAPHNKLVKPSAEDAEAIQWIKTNTDPSDVLVCARDPMYYLYTGRKATCSLPVTGTVYWQNSQTRTFDIVDESNGRYLVLTPSDFEEAYQPELQTESFKNMIEGHPERFAPVFRSTSGKSIVFRVGEASPER